MTGVTVRFLALPHGRGLPPPAYQSTDAAGLDMRAAIAEAESLVISPGARQLVPTGVAIALPPGFEGQLRSRSGLALRHGIAVLNAPGTIDADYRGEIMALLINHGKRPFSIARGDRIAQLVIAPVAFAQFEETTDLGATARGASGYGSTGIE